MEENNKDILCESEVCKYLSLPSIPLKEWDNKSSFDKAVCVIKMYYSGYAYAVCTFNAEVDEAPRVIKNFLQEPFVSIEDVFIVPAYMDVDNIDDADLDEKSKEAAKRLAEEAKEASEEQVDEKEKEMKQLPEWVFDNIHNVEEARAFIQSYNSQNKIKGRIPTNEETLKLRLLTIWNDIQNKNK